MQDDYQQIITNFFDGRTSSDSEGRGHPENAKKLLDFVAVQPDQAKLDLCTGTGLLAISLAKAVVNHGSAIGVDMSSGMLAQAKAKIKAAGINNLELIKANVESIDFNDEQFDTIFCCSALVYVSDIPALLDKCHCWLKPGGCLAFTSSEKGSSFIRS